MSLKSLFKPERLSPSASLGLLPVRILAGIAFMIHGWGKIQSPFTWGGPDIPGILQGLAALAEFGGGLAWIVGLLTPLASFGIACTMVVAIHMLITKMDAPFVPTGLGTASWELAGLFLTIALLLMFTGPGRFSADRFVFGEKDS